MPFQWGPPAVCPFPGEEMSPNKNKNKNKKTKTKQTNKKRQKKQNKNKNKKYKNKTNRLPISESLGNTRRGDRHRGRLLKKLVGDFRKRAQENRGLFIEF